MNDDDKFDLLAAEYIAMKDAEIAAKRRLEDVERRLLAAMDVRPGDTKTKRVRLHEVTVKAGLRQTVDQAIAAEIIGELPDEQGALVIKYAFSLTGVQALERYHPEAVAILRRAITTKPSKPTIKVTET